LIPLGFDGAQNVDRIDALVRETQQRHDYNNRYQKKRDPDAVLP
jgi:hypothetical protein